jgi:hypothetical protein
VLRKIFCLFVLGILSACATGYQSNSLTGGYDQTPGPGSLEKISFYGNGYVDAATVQKYALYRCAEVAKEKKKPYFLMFDSLVSASVNKSAALPTVGTVGKHPMAFAFVLMLDAPQKGAMGTEKVLKELEPVVKQKQDQAK